MAWFQNNFAEMYFWLSHILFECYDTFLGEWYRAIMALLFIFLFQYIYPFSLLLWETTLNNS